MTIVLETDEVLCQRYGLSPAEARAVIAEHPSDPDRHCAAVAARLADDLYLLTGSRLHGARNIPAMALAKNEAIKDLMFTERPGILGNRENLL